MTDFKKLIKEVKAKQEAADKPITDDPRTHGVQLGRARRAQEDLKALFEQYKREVSARAVFIIPVGAERQQFADIASSDSFGCFKVRVDDMYEEITQDISPVLYTNSAASPSLLDILQDQFQSIADEIGIMSYPMVIFKSKYSRTLNKKEDLIAFTKQAFNEDMGLEVVGYYTIHKVANQAIKEDFAGKIVPIIIDTEDSDLAKALVDGLKKISPFVYAVEAEKEVDEKLVKQVLIDIRKKVKI